MRILWGVFIVLGLADAWNLQAKTRKRHQKNSDQAPVEAVKKDSEDATLDIKNPAKRELPAFGVFDSAQFKFRLTSSFGTY